ncbi:MAG: pantetheine-phosphate adenylyltransferase [Proteobacteria bacterium]|nr:pantetheine-phosphate adenylyltransferase [Pseudomonadota bacterium]
MGRVAIYAGSFDPLTMGHIDIISRGAKLFDELVVAIGNNPSKSYMFDLEERKVMVSEACQDIPGLRVVTFAGLLVQASESEGANVILRGLRAFADFELEFRNGLANRDLSGIETVFMLADPPHIFISSSLVKEISINGGDISSYVPGNVLTAMRRRLAN